MDYAHPQFIYVNQKHITGAISVATAVDSAYVGSTLRSFTAAIVMGVSFRIGSGGSIAGSNSFKVGRINALGTLSIQQVFTSIISAGASAAADCYDIALTNGMTIHSMGEAAVLIGQAASLDKIPVLSDVIWRFRVAPSSDYQPTQANQG